MPMQTEPTQIKLTKKEIESLQLRLQERELTDDDIVIINAVLDLNFWVQEELAGSKLSIKRLQKLFGFTTERNSKPQPANNPNNENQSVAPRDEEPDESIDLSQEGSQWDEEKNHGRLAASDYTGLSIEAISHSDELIASGSCPECAASNSDGKLYRLPPSSVILLESQPLISGTHYQLERSRCRLCSQYFTAKMPPEHQGQPKYASSCYTQIAIWHYYAGVPFKRLEMLQLAQGVPLSDATQYDLMKSMYHNVVEPVVSALRQEAADSTMLFFDDTSATIVEQTLENKRAETKKDKSAIHATALLAENNGHKICLFDTGTEPAGKSMKKLLKQRKSAKPFKTMSDASPVNFEDLEDNLMAKWIISLCLVHSRRKFHELLADEDQEIQLVLDIMSKVYQNERHCKQGKLNDEERLLYHQKHSEPLMAALFTWLNNLILHKEVEPNSRFGQAIIYLLKRWEHFTQFLKQPGVALDNNPCEQTIKVLIRYRNNSKIYRTFFGATIGDAYMSLIHTAILAKVNVFDYLNQLQAHHEMVQIHPRRWLPWCYLETLATINEYSVPPD